MVLSASAPHTHTMHFADIISGGLRVESCGPVDERWLEACRAAVDRQRGGDARHTELDEMDAPTRALVAGGADRLVAAVGARHERFRVALARAFVITYDADDAVSSHDVHVDPRVDVTLNVPLTPDDEYDGGELFFRLSNERSQMIDAKSDEQPEIMKLVEGRFLRHSTGVPRTTGGECAFLRQRRGRALVHSGAAPHGATALERGRRANLILWCVRVHALPRWGQAPDDVRRAVVDFSHWRDMLSLAATSKAERRLVLPFWKVDRARQALISRYVAAARLGLGMRMNAVVNNAATAVAMGVHAAVGGADDISSTIRGIAAVIKDLWDSGRTSVILANPDLAAALDRNRESRARSIVPEVLVHVFLEDPSLSYVDKRRRGIFSWAMSLTIADDAPARVGWIREGAGELSFATSGDWTSPRLY